MTTPDSSGIPPTQNVSNKEAVTTDTTDSMSNAELFAACAKQSMDNQNSIMMGLSQVGNVINKGISWLNDLMKQLTNIANESMADSNKSKPVSQTLQDQLSLLGIDASSKMNASEIQGDVTAVSNYQNQMATQAQKVTTELNNNYQYYNKIVQFVSNTVSGQKSVVDQITSNM